MTGSGSRAGGNEKRLTKEVAKAIIKVLDEACFGEMDLWQKYKRKKTVESVAETLCSFSRFLCDLVIGIYLFVILAVLPLYNRGYAQIGTDKENFFIKTMTYVGKCLLPVFVLWLILRFIVVKQKQELPEFRTIPKRIWQALNTTDKFAALYGIAVVMSYVFTRYREEALWGTASWRMGMWTSWERSLYIL